MQKALWLVLPALMLGGCAYKVRPMAAKAHNVYSSHDEKVAGRYGIVFDQSLSSADRTVKPSTHMCSGHTFPVQMEDAFELSLRQTFEMIFEEVVVLERPPSAERSKADGLRGYALVRLDEFKPRFSCAPGFWSGTCTATTELTFGVTVRGEAGTLFSTAASGSKTADGDSGQYCDGAVVVLQESIERSTRDALERLAERLSNSPKLRAQPAAVAQ